MVRNLSKWRCRNTQVAPNLFVKVHFALVLSLPFFSSSNAIGIELSGNISYGEQYKTNVLEAPFDTTEDVVQTGRIELGVVEERKGFQLDSDFSLEHERYRNQTFEENTSVTSGFGLLNVSLLENYVDWQASFTRTDVLEDSADPENPDTREYRNILRTGPVFSFSFSETLKGLLTSNYILIENSDEDAADSERAEGDATITYLFNRLTDFTSGVSYQEIIDSDDDEEVENTNARIGFNRRFTDGFVTFNIGQQRVSTSNNNSSDEEDNDSDFFDINVVREDFFGQEGRISYSEKSTDTAIGFIEDETGNVDEIEDRVREVSIIDVETRKRTSFDLSRDFGEWLYFAKGVYEESDFRISQQTERYRSFQVGIKPKLLSKLVLGLDYRYIRRDFKDILEGEDISDRYNVSLDYQAVPDIFISSFMRYEIVDNDIKPSRQFEDFNLGLRVRWEFL